MGSNLSQPPVLRLFSWVVSSVPLGECRNGTYKNKCCHFFFIFFFRKVVLVKGCRLSDFRQVKASEKVQPVVQIKQINKRCFSSRLSSRYSDYLHSCGADYFIFLFCIESFVSIVFLPNVLVFRHFTRLAKELTSHLRLCNT